MTGVSPAAMSARAASFTSKRPGRGLFCTLSPPPGLINQLDAELHQPGSACLQYMAEIWRGNVVVRYSEVGVVGQIEALGPELDAQR